MRHLEGLCFAHDLGAQGKEAGRGPSGEVKPEEVGKLAALSGVWEFPMRVKCATLAWHTLRSALDGKGDEVSTEGLD